MADTNKTVAYGVTADPSGFEKGMQTAADSARNAASQIDSNFKKVQDAFGQVQKQLLVLASIVAGGAFFKDAINESNKLTGETMKLARALGINAQEASVLNSALNDIGSDSDTYVDTFSKFARQLKSNEAGLKALGLQTRDSNGDLRDANELFTEALQSVGQYKAGLDQNTYAQTVFGKSIDDVMKLQKLNTGVLEEARRKNEELGLTITQDNVVASKAYRMAMNDVGDVLTAVKKVIGDAVMPVFTELGEYFASTGPYVVAVFKGAMMGLLTVFEIVKGAVKTVMGVIFESFNAIIDVGALLGEMIAALLHGDFSGAYQAGQKLGQRLKQGFDNIVQNFVDAGDEVGEAVQKHYDRLYGEKKGAPAPTGGTKRMADHSAWDAQMAALETQEAAFKNNTDAKLAILAQESAMVKQRYGEQSKEYQAVQKKILETRRQAADQQKQIAMEIATGESNAMLAQVQTEEQHAKLQRELGTITELDLLQKNEEFENRRNAIAEDALKERERIAMADPDRNPVEIERIHQQIEEAERGHQARLAEIRNQAVKESQKYTTMAIDAMGSGFARVFQQTMQGTLTLRGAVQGMWKATQDAVTQALARMAADWIVLQLKNLIFGKMVAAAEIKTESAKAGAGGVASMAAAPWPLNMTAPMFGAEMAAAAAGFGAVASAAGGYDIPSTINPLTQLHASEMVLPAKHADVIRNMADQGQPGGGGDNFTVHVHATDAQSVARLFRDNGDALVKVLAGRKRDFAF